MTATPISEPSRRPRSDAPFVAVLAVIGGFYVFLIIAMLVADVAFLKPPPAPGQPTGLPAGIAAMARAAVGPLRSPEIRFALQLSLVSCTITAILSILVAAPLGYLLSRFQFPLKGLVDAILDIPIVLPPLVIGLSLLILFQTPPGRWFERHVGGVTYEVPSVILAQFSVACAFAVRTMRVTFDQINIRTEQVALTLGCTRFQAYWHIALPEAWRGTLTAGTLAWARAMGEFGPILVFSGATRMRTEVLPTTVFLELSVGNIESAVAVSLLMVLAALVVLLIVRLAGSYPMAERAVPR